MINLTLLLYKIVIDITFIIYQSHSINYLVKKKSCETNYIAKLIGKLIGIRV